jgi:SAM-dependent methyltransferase
MDGKQHWENVYENKQPHEVSWTQEVPQTSLDFIVSLNLAKDAKLIDIGGGDSKLPDFLLESGYTDITVLDISAKALERAKARLGSNASKIKWVISDVTEFEPAGQYDVWHDRAAFHFLTTPEQISKYKAIIGSAVKGYLVMGTFSTNGPLKCSGLEIKQYSEQSLEEQLSPVFKKVKCLTEDHQTPFGTSQNFLFCSFKRSSAKS